MRNSRSHKVDTLVLQALVRVFLPRYIAFYRYIVAFNVFP